MNITTIDRIELPPAADMHVHLRQGDMMKLVTPTIVGGGVDTVFVMPNLQPPLTKVDQVLQYKEQLQAIAPTVKFLMSLYLTPEVTPEVIAQAAKAGITGVKMYPQGGTTNSEDGVANLKDFYDTFGAMEKHDMVLNLHGEVLQAECPEGKTLEEAFLPKLKELHEKFPNLRIVLEHCTTAAAVNTVLKCGDNVCATITAHHLYLTSSDAEVDAFAFCKPIPKTEEDKKALLKTIVSGNKKFFFGSDSAPHPVQKKTSLAPGQAPAAGVFTQPYAVQLVLHALEEGIKSKYFTEEDVTQEKLEGFLCRFGRRFYKLEDSKFDKKIVLERKGDKIAETVEIKTEGGEAIEVRNSRAGTTVFSLKWEDAA